MDSHQLGTLLKEQANRLDESGDNLASAIPQQIHAMEGTHDADALLDALSATGEVVGERFLADLYSVLAENMLGKPPVEVNRSMAEAFLGGYAVKSLQEVHGEAEKISLNAVHQGLPLDYAVLADQITRYHTLRVTYEACLYILSLVDGDAQ